MSGSVVTVGIDIKLVLQVVHDSFVTRLAIVSDINIVYVGDLQ